jgi:hypothetical protein
MEKMARKSNAKPKMKIGKEKSARVCSPAGGVEAGIQTAEEEKQVMPNMYSDIIQSLFERTRKRVSTYYCPNMSCRRTFWEAEEGYECPACGALGIISEFKYKNVLNDSRSRNIVGYVDTLGRLICGNCILKYGVQNEIGLIVYDDTEPFCNEPCELCKEPLGQLQS